MNRQKPTNEFHVTWLTNFAAPYRIPIWNRMGRSQKLKVIFTLPARNYRNWGISNAENFSFEYLSKRFYRFGDFDLVLGTKGAERVVNSTDFLIVGGWDTFFYFKAIRCAKKIGIPVILYYESTLSSRRFNNYFVRRFRSMIFSLADHVITAGSASTDAALDIGVPREKILTLFNPVDVGWFARLTAQRHPRNSSGHHYLYVGQLIARKNVKGLIKAFSIIRNPFDLLTIIGDGPLSRQLKDYVDELSLNEVVRFLGHMDQEQVVEEYANADTLILPSTNEVWGLVVNEALASGLHVIVSNVAGVAQSIKHMEGVFITSPEIDEISKNMELSRSQWQGPIAKPEMLNFTPEKFADEVIELVDSLVLNKSSTSLIWLTNYPVPYRVPIWNELNSKLDFQVVFLEHSSNGRIWDLSSSMSALNFITLKTRALRMAEIEPIYLDWRIAWAWIKQQKPKALYIDGYESPSFFLTAWKARRNGIKIILGYRSTLLSRRFNNYFVRRFRSMIFSLADHVITAGSASTDAALDIGVPREKILTLFNPVDVGWFARLTAQRHPRNSSGHHYLYVGQLIARKNVKGLIKAFSIIRNPFDLLTIIGDGPLSRQLKDYVDELSLNEVVRFLGHMDQEQVVEEYANADTLILPSTNEVWGLVVNEALASGLHVIVSNVAGVAQSIKHMEGVFITSPEIDEISKNMELSRSQWQGPIAKPEMLNFTPEKFADEVIELVDSLVNLSS